MGKPTDERETPQWLFDELNDEFRFGIDVAASDENAKVNVYFTEEIDGLKQNWFKTLEHGTTTEPPYAVWMNPPYSDITPWLKKAQDATYDGITTVALLPASTSAKWFHRHLWNGMKHRPYWDTQLRFLPKRLIFGPHNTSAMWPSMIAVIKGWEA